MRYSLSVYKRVFFTRLRSNKKWLVRFLVVACILCVVFSLLAGRNSTDQNHTVVPAISYIQTSEKIYTVTVNINGKESKETLKLFIDVCSGLNVKPTFFMTSEWLEKNTETAILLRDGGANIALLCSGTAIMSRNELMRYVAVQNDLFYNKLSLFPKYVRESGAANPYMGEILNAYGQYYISSSYSPDSEKSLVPGDILSMELTINDDVYTFARLVSGGISNGLTAVDMKDFVKEYKKDE